MTKKKKIKIDDFINEEVENIETQIKETEEPIIEEVIVKTPESEVEEIIPEPEIKLKEEEIITEQVVEEKIKQEVKTLSYTNSRMMRRIGK